MIRLRGLRTHNLKSLDLDLSLNKLIVVTGVSGAGKSSLALDTLYAEGQRRYVETFSPYLRQFLERMEKPPADRIEGLPPAVLVSSGRLRPSSRATIGTQSDVQPLLGLLFSRAGKVYCRNCGLPVSPATPRSIASEIDEFPAGTRYRIAFPLDLTSESEWRTITGMLKEDGLTRIVVAGRQIDLDQVGGEVSERSFEGERTIDVIIDRMIRGREPTGRRIDSIETALRKGLGRCRILTDSVSRTFVRGWKCGDCGTDHIEPQPNLFRSNSPLGACPTCEGLGFIREASNQKDADRGKNRKSRRHGENEEQCPTCLGARLRPEALAARLAGKNFAEFSSLDARAFRRALEEVEFSHDREAGEALSRRIADRLDTLEAIGLDYLTIDRRLRDLSRGELDRLLLARTIGEGLVNTLHVLDEPTNGLHPHDVDRLVAMLEKLRDRGNTLLVVEHDQVIIRAADRVLDLGPGAGELGGSLVFDGTPTDLANSSNSVTGAYLAGRSQLPMPGKRRKPSKGWIQLRGASGNNLKGVDVDFPLGMLCAVSGISGAGKSSLTRQTLVPALRGLLGETTEAATTALPFRELTLTGSLGKVILVDQSPIGRSGRSNPVTYMDAFGEIRKTFAATHEAKTRNYKPSHFSFNVDGGRCNSCRGEGILTIDMQFLPNVTMRCPDCRGTRYRPEILEVAYRGRNIAEVLDMTVRDAFLFFRHRSKIQMKLRPLIEIGLDYLRLGQAAATLSGGEAQRVKLASQLARTRSDLIPGRSADVVPILHVLDQPTSGLHPADIAKLLEVLNALVDRGHSVIFVEHDSEVLARCDWIIDLGPEAGNGGGQVVAAGTPEQISEENSYTGKFLKPVLGNFR